MTKSKTPNIDLGRSEGRYTEREQRINVAEGGSGPGTYDDRYYEWGSKSKGFTIGERRE